MGFLWGILIVLLLNGLIFPNVAQRQIKDTDYGTFINKVDSGKVKEVAIKSGQIFFTAEENGQTRAYKTGETNDPQLVERLLKADSPNESHKISFNQIVPQENSPLLNFILWWVLPGLIFYLIWRQATRSLGKLGAGGNFMSFGNSGAKIYAEADIKTTFADVAGQDEAKETLTEIVDFLHNPGKYADVGASLPKGALLVRPSGDRKDFDCPRRGGRGQGAFLRHIRLGVRTDVRGHGRRQGARLVPAGRRESALHHLYR